MQSYLKLQTYGECGSLSFQGVHNQHFLEIPESAVDVLAASLTSFHLVFSSVLRGHSILCNVTVVPKSLERKLKLKMKRNLTFQHDSDCKHMSKSTKEWYKRCPCNAFAMTSGQILPCRLLLNAVIKSKGALVLMRVHSCATSLHFYFCVFTQICSL